MPGYHGVQGHTRRVFANLREVAPLVSTASAHLPDREVGQAPHAASKITRQVARWCDAALDHLPASHPYGRARALTGAQVTDDTDLATSKLAGAKVEMPAVVYGELRVACAYHSADDRTGPGFAADLIQPVSPTDTMTWAPGRPDWD